jgi:hypothetical protein
VSLIPIITSYKLNNERASAMIVAGLFAPLTEPYPMYPMDDLGSPVIRTRDFGGVASVGGADPKDRLRDVEQSYSHRARPIARGL